MKKLEWIQLAQLWAADIALILLAGVAYDHNWVGIFHALMLVGIGGAIGCLFVTVEHWPRS